MSIKNGARDLVPMAWMIALLLLGLPAGADWLVTKDGKKLETKGSWKVQDGKILFHDTKGRLMSMATGDIDMEASKAATLLARAPKAPTRGAVPSKAPVLRITNADIPQAAEDSPAAQLDASGANAAPKVTLYSTTWCGYCRMARKLLNEMDVAFVEKDIEKSSAARREHAALSRGGGVPVLNIDGQVVRGYSAERIRGLVGALQAKEAKAAEEAEAAKAAEGEAPAEEGAPR